MMQNNNQVWQSSHHPICDAAMFGMPQVWETTVAAFGQLADVVNDAVFYGDDTCLCLHLFGSLLHQHVSPPPNPDASAPTSLPTATAAPVPPNTACTGAALPNRLDINGSVSTSAWHKHPQKFPCNIAIFVGGDGNTHQCQWRSSPIMAQCHAQWQDGWPSASKSCTRCRLHHSTLQISFVNQIFFLRVPMTAFLLHPS